MREPANAKQPMNPPSPELPKIEQIKQALFAGQKIAAIKIYREHTNSGLAEAKTAIEKLEAELRVTQPEKFTAPPPVKVGCVGALLAVVLLALVVAVAISLLLFVRK